MSESGFYGKGVSDKLNLFFIKLYVFTAFIGYVLSLMGLILMHANISSLGGHAFKVGFILSTMVVVLIAIINKIKIDKTNLFFLLISLWGMIIGIFQNHLFEKPFYSHFYGAILPVLGIVFGEVFVRISQSQPWLPSKKLVRNLIFVHGFLLVIYFSLYKLGVINYFGVSTNLFTFFGFTLARGDFFGSFSSLVFAFLSGKRVVIVAMVVTSIVYFIFRKRQDFQKKRINSKVPNFLLVLLTIAALWIAYFFGLLDRFNPILEMDFSNSEKVYEATSGRTFEISYLIESISENPVLWWTGGGFGAYFVMPQGLHELETMRMHYSHFSPLYVVLVYGIPIAIIYYCILIFYLFKARIFVDNPFILLAFTGFALSFAGCTLLVDINFWCCLGVAKALVDGKKDKTNCAYLRNLSTSILKRSS